MQDSYPISSKTISLIKLWLFTLLLNIKLILFYNFTLYLIHIKKQPMKKVSISCFLVFASFTTSNEPITISGKSQILRMAR
jgi:hypothetical protein